jgi:uncharacterized integral membrane protein (TIGR00698 family)
LKPEPAAATSLVRAPSWLQTDDVWAMLVAASLLTTAWWTTGPAIRTEAPDDPPVCVSRLAAWVATPGPWRLDPRQAFTGPQGAERDGRPSTAVALVATVVGCVAIFAVALAGTGSAVGRSVPALTALALLALLAWLVSSQEVVRRLQLEYVLWAFAIGLAVSNLVGVPEWLRPALRGELFIKTGLVLMGASLLFGTLMRLGPPGILVSWITTPVVLIATYQFGQRVLGIESRTLNLVLSADMSVCGVSAAVATAAACRAKKEELSVAIGISLAFTVVMMFALPAVIRLIGLDEVLAGAWIGGTVDSTGAVVAAGELVGPVARDVAASVKLIQNVLIGVISLAVAALWARSDAPGTEAADSTGSVAAAGLGEIWRRMPKFVLGFIAASAVFTALASAGGPQAAAAVKVVLAGPVKSMQSWCFCLGFVAIGLETEIRRLARVMGSTKPLVLYVCGQCLNLSLTLAMAWVAFRLVFPDVAARLMSGG